MTVEDQLCLFLSCGELAPGWRNHAAKLLACPLNWSLLLECAIAQQTFPLLYRNLRNLQFHTVPNQVRTKLSASFQVNALRNDLLAKELARVLHVLHDARIPVIPLKGIALAESLYADRALRVCSDIDILVPVGAVMNARRLILNRGFMSPFSESFFVHHQLHTSADCTLLPAKSKVPYVLEVHWKILEHSALDGQAVDDLWSEARRNNFLGVPVYSCSPEWELLFLSWHAACHKWQMLKWLVDIHDLCATRFIDWQKVRKKTDRLDLTAVVEITLSAIAKLFDTEMPDGFATRTLPFDVEGPTASVPSVQSEHGWRLFYPRLLTRRSDKLRWLLDKLFVARLADNSFFRLPPSLSFLYYLLRPLRLTCKWSWLLLCAGIGRARRWLRSADQQA